MEGKADVIETVRGVGYRFKEPSADDQGDSEAASAT